MEGSLSKWQRNGFCIVCQRWHGMDVKKKKKERELEYNIAAAAVHSQKYSIVLAYGAECVL